MQAGISGEKGLNFITTSHREREEAAMYWLYKTTLKYGYILRLNSHSHPNGSIASPDDAEYKNTIINKQRQAGYYAPKFSIYYVREKKEIPF